MKRGIGRRGFSPSEELIWLLAQVIGALVFTLVLTGYVDGAVRGGLLAKQFYPGNFGLLETVVASSPDNMVMGDFVDKFKDTEFSFTGTNNRIEVTANTIKAPSRFWVFTPKAVTASAFTITPATGVVHAVKEGNQVTLRKGNEFQFNTLLCPQVSTGDSNGLAKKNVVVISDDARIVGSLDAHRILGDVSARVGALLGAGSGTGVTIKLAVDPVVTEKTRIVAYYNPKASDDMQLKSIKLG